MGRDVTGLRIDKKSNMVNDKSTDSSSHDEAVQVAPKALPEKLEDQNAKARVSEDVVGVKSPNNEIEEKIIKAEAHKSTDQKLSLSAKPESGSDNNGTITTGLEAEKQASSGAENNGSGVKVSPKSNDLDSPKSANKKSQSNSHFMSRKQLQPNFKNFYDEDDNWSLASSTATSVRTKITVPVAPRFSCVNRLERRKEYYTKLEEKHRALEKEKLDYEARTKEEEQAAIKQLRKSMVVKANPVPSFYREGPPPKVELKKLPVTRAKSPNLSRRKSCGDAVKVKPSPEDKGRPTRHSVGIYKQAKASPPTQKKASPSPITPKSKERSDVRKLNNGSKKVKNQSKETTENSPGNADIAAVES